MPIGKWLQSTQKIKKALAVTFLPIRINSRRELFALGVIIETAALLSSIAYRMPRY
jgi:hypothetical protein